jgi:hypothetical protein
MGPLRNYLPNFSNSVYYKQQRHLWACAKQLGDRKLNRPSLDPLAKVMAGDIGFLWRATTRWAWGGRRFREEHKEKEDRGRRQDRFSSFLFDAIHVMWLLLGSPWRALAASIPDATPEGALDWAGPCSALSVSLFIFFCHSLSVWKISWNSKMVWIRDFLKFGIYTNLKFCANSKFCSI